MSDDKRTPDPSWFDDIESHLENEQFRRRIMLFQRCDNVLQPLLTNLQELQPKTDEELILYETFIAAARTILKEMRPLLPENTWKSLNERISIYEDRRMKLMRGAVDGTKQK